MNTIYKLYEYCLLRLFFWSAARLWKIGWAYEGDDGQCAAFIMADDPLTLDLLLRDGFYSGE
ncbi:MAG TPA: hypothetical protein VFH61_15455 [Thermoleophilia bacterium]|nr:hypothetical protein [Thermoleophilia bacterium]